MAKSSYQKELERRANDLLIVYNPSDKDYVIEWDRRDGVKLFRVPSKKEAVLVRYIAEKYLREMYEKLIIDKADKSVREENEKRVIKGMAEMTKHNEQLRFESKFYNQDSREAKELLSVLYVGVQQEYGIDRSMPEESQEIDDRPSFTKALEEIQEEKQVQTRSNHVDEPSEPTDPLACSYPGCDFVAKAPLGLISHKRTHRDELEDVKQKAVAGVSA